MARFDHPQTIGASRQRELERDLFPARHFALSRSSTFPNYGAVNVFYKSEDGYLGPDEMTIFLIFPDGTGAEWHYNIQVM
jgi:hypothetical protein